MVAGHGEALAIVQKQKGLNATHVFSLRGKRSELTRTGRHAPPLFALQELGGWESSEKVAGMRISQRITWRRMRVV